MDSAFVGMRTLLRGQVAQAESLARETLDRGQAFDPPNAPPLFAAQLYCVRREQGRLAERVPILEIAAAAQPELPILRAAR